jgi:glycosyltransferase involved in cell wall biosynthesis
MITTELSIIVPCFNNEDVLSGTVKALNDVVVHHTMNVETLIVDDQSTDATLTVAKHLIRECPALHIRVFERKRRFHAYGSILRFGLAYATGRYCAVVSPDGYDSVELLPKFVDSLRQGAQLVQCSRYIREEDAKTVRLRFRLFQSVYRFFVRLFLGVDITDTTNGFRGFDRNYVLALGLFSGRRNVFPEMTFKVLLSGGRIEFVPGKEHRPIANASTRFKLRHEMPGYAAVLLRAALHRWGLAWF